MSLLDTALAYHRSGLCVLPVNREEKRPTLSRWKPYQTNRPTEQQLGRWFPPAVALCLVTGEVSGQLELLDFDQGGELFDAWRGLVETESPELLARLVIEHSQSGGRHVAYRCLDAVPGNQKLAERDQVVSGPDPVTIGGKTYVPRRVGERYEVRIALIETRGEGGLFLCDPTPGYQLQQGTFLSLPTLTTAERSLLINAARSLSDCLPPAEPLPSCSSEVASGRPGDDFNERGDPRPTLIRHGWRLVQGGENEYWRRPGKTNGWSATLRNRVLYVFSSNAAPFEPDRAYSPFAVYALLEHQGDFSAAAVALRAEGYGEATNEPTVDLSQFRITVKNDPAKTSEAAESDRIPVELLRIPGLVSEVMDHCLETAPYPNVPLAFCGAVALQALLAGRKVRDQADNRTNLYLLALGFSAVGKDWPRKVNTAVLHRIGQIEALGEKFASGEGLQDALFHRPAMLFQTDEIDGLLQSINKSKDARYENLLGTLLTLYSSANSIYPMRRKAGDESAGVIDQPCLVVLGTAIPSHYYAALSERMLTNGFFARMVIVESGPRSAGQEPGIIDPPPRVLETARWWSDFCPGTGNLMAFYPRPLTVEADEAARRLLTEGRQASDAEYSRAEGNGDPVGTTVWGRVPEQTRKLALLYAVSADHQAPRITSSAARWALEFVSHQTRRMLSMARRHVAENPFHAECLRLLGKLRDAPEQQLPHSVLLKRMKIDAKTFQELVGTLEQQGDLASIIQSTAGRTQRVYQLVGDDEEGVKEGGETSLAG